MIKDQVLNSFKGKNALVTGGTGMIGRQIVDILCDAGANVNIVSLDKLNVHKKATHIFGDLRNYDFCQEVTKGMDFVFHVAGIKCSIDITKKMPASHFVPALMFNTNVIEACRANKVSKVVFTSSIGAYANGETLKETENVDGPPMDFYAGWAKRMAEFQIQTYKIQYNMNNYAVVRPSNVYGPGDNFDPNNAMVIPSLMFRIFKGENPLRVWGDGTAVRDFVYSRDVAEGVILALHHGTGSSFVNLGGVRGYTIRELVETLNKVIDFKYEFDTTKPSGFHKRVMDISFAQKKIDYNPTTSLEDGLRKTWEWFNANKEEYLKRQNYFTK